MNNNKKITKINNKVKQIKQQQQKEEEICFKSEDFKINKINGDMIKRILENNKLFENVLKQNKGFIENIISKYIHKNDENYDDLVQIAHIGLWRAIQQYNKARHNASTFSTFAHIVIKNDVLLEIKRINKEKKMFVLINDLCCNDFKNNEDYNKYISVNCDYDFENKIIDKIFYEQKVAKRSNLEQSILKLRQNGYTIKEISKLLNKNISTIKLIYYNALNQLQMESKRDEIKLNINVT